MGLIALVVIGAAAGFLATRLMKLETDIPTTMFIGILGTVLGGLILRGLTMLTGWMGGFVGAVLAAMLLIWLWRFYFKK